MRQALIIGFVTIGIVFIPSCEAIVIEPERIQIISKPEQIDSLDNIYPVEYPVEVDCPVVPEDHLAIACMVKKAHQIADIEWQPLRSIPSLSDNWIPAGTQMQGIPYSSVKEKDKFVGQEVSFYTFMSAVQNPRSVLYTEDVKKFPYHGANCGMYYGTVCSMAVNYALGIERPVESKMYEYLPYIARVKYQNLDELYAGDILWSEGHVVLIIGIDRDKGGLPDSFSILESSGKTRIKSLSREAFKIRWEEVGWVAYRYLKLAENVKYEPLPFVKNPGDPEVSYNYNYDLCTSRGDYACFLYGEEVTINIFDTTFDKLEVFNNGILLKEIIVDPIKEDYVLANLPGGIYEAQLSSNDRQSDPIHFEVIDEDTKVIYNNGGYIVSFNSNNAISEYVVICLRNGRREAIIDISDKERLENSMYLKGNYSGYYLKVFYKGKYGRVSNSPIIL